MSLQISCHLLSLLSYVVFLLSTYRQDIACEIVLIVVGLLQWLVQPLGFLSPFSVVELALSKLAIFFSFDHFFSGNGSFAPLMLQMC